MGRSEHMASLETNLVIKLLQSNIRDHKIDEGEIRTKSNSKSCLLNVMLCSIKPCCRTLKSTLLCFVSSEHDVS